MFSSKIIELSVNAVESNNFFFLNCLLKKAASVDKFLENLSLSIDSNFSVNIFSLKLVELSS